MSKMFLSINIIALGLFTANSSFADGQHPEGHKTYATNRNNGHSWVEIDKYFTLDPQFGYKHGDHDPDKYKKR